MASQQTWGVASNDENVMPDDLKRRILRPRTTQGIPKRSALSVINNVQAKPGKSNVAILKKPAVVSSNQQSLIPPVPLNVKPVGNKFCIFRDNSQIIKEESTSDIPSNVTKLYKHVPVATKSIPEPITPDEPEDECSPMVLDSSMDQSCLDSTHKEEKPFLCARIYDKDIYAYLRQLERKFRPNPSYIRKQPDVNHNMRSILVDWLVEVAEEYKMRTETLYLSVYYIDRFLSHMSVQKSKLQLVGTACMFIASKLEEIYPPELKDFVYITDDTYTKKQVLRMEHLILKVLAFDLTSPTAHYFIQHFCCICEISDKVRYLAQYISELALLDSEPFLNFLPSEMAAASLYLANSALGKEPWTDEHISVTGYDVMSLATCIKSMHGKHRTMRHCAQQAMVEKYKSSRYDFVSMIEPCHLTL